MNELPYLFRDRDARRNRRVYARIHGVGKVRLREQPGTTAFVEEYGKAIAELEQRAKKPKVERSPVGTMRWLVAEFEASYQFQRVTQRERRGRHNLVQSALDVTVNGVKFGDLLLKYVTPKVIRHIRDLKKDVPSAANHRLSNLRLIFNWAVEERSDVVKANPCLGVKALAYKVVGIHTWSEDQMAQYETHFPIGSQARLAYDLLLYTGARRGDVVALGPKSLVKFVNPQTKQTETWITFEPGKTSRSTGKVLTLPLLPQLAASMEAIATKGLTTFLLNTHHKPHATGDSFANWFKDRVREAGLPDHCSPHGLRKAGACRAADNGATEKQMMAIYGWSTSRLAAYYAQKANEKKLASSALHLLTKA
jgi:integrase